MIDDFSVPPTKEPAKIDDPGKLKSSPTDGRTFVRPAPSFRTPEEVAADDSSGSGNDSVESRDGQTHEELLLPAHAGGKKAARTITLFHRWTFGRKKFYVACAVSAVFLLGGATAFAMTRHSAPTTKPVAKKAAKVAAPAPKPIVSPLDGMPVTADKLSRPVVGAMIENSPDARPQSGLGDAGVVYEAIAEAGITRFLALYQEQDTANIGPVRSSRPYYLDWAMAFDAAYAHVGGSPDALQRIKDIQVRDMDQFFNPSAYHRVTNRYAPHNVYSSVPQLRDLAISKGYDKSTFTSFARKAEQPYKAPSPTPSPKPGSKTAPKATGDTRTPASTIDFNISGAYYNAHYDYDAPSNSYKRSEGGAPHIDANSGNQIAPKVVMALVMPYSLMADGYHSQYNTQGSGKAYLFQDGTVTTGTWTKGEPKSQFEFKDDNGKTMQLNPGMTWITAVADEGKVSYR
jgi:hypothetical protein